MSPVPINTLLPLSRRLYSIAAMASEAARITAAASAATQRVTVAAESSGKAKEEIFWMRDPKTGNWIPENRFGEIDVADLRAQVLPKK